MALTTGASDVAHSRSVPDCPSWQTWLARRRVTISLVVFTTLVVADMFLLGVRPRDICDWSDAGTVAGELLIAIGLAVRSWAAGTLHKSQRLVRLGPYALVRNPLYVGSFCMMVGFCALVQDSQSIWFIVGPVALLYWFQIRFEETRLAHWFAAEWPLYAAATGRFIPRRFTRDAFRGWTLSRWLQNREYRAVLSSLVSLAGLALWRALSG